MIIRNLEIGFKNNRIIHHQSMPPKKQPNATITSSGRVIKPRVDMATYSSLEEDSFSDSDSDDSISPLAPSTSRKPTKKLVRKRTSSNSSSKPSTPVSKEYQEKRARNNDAVRRSRQRRREKQNMTKAWLDSASREKRELEKMDDKLDKELKDLKEILQRTFTGKTINLSSFLAPDAITNLVMQSVSKREDYN